VKVLVTGSAGFIGMHVAQRLLARGDEVVGFDNLSDYYDVSLKRARLARLLERKDYTHVQADLPTAARSKAVFEVHEPRAWCTWPRRPACVTPRRTRTCT
jgi:UDP-glucuronate 4-epimerase